ncbi:MAG: hypothetical protein M3373_09745, partial [Gemmatimonadota bacterium]|nr:hypothetical protein [Gemmatimonadota bacterium]
MNLADLITPDRVIAPLNASNVTDAGRALLERLVVSGAVHDSEQLWTRVNEEHGQDTVAMGDRAFVKHYRTDAVRDVVVALGTSPQPIRRE